MNASARSLLLLLATSAVISAAAACRGPRGGAGGPGPTGSPGPTGPSQVPPEIEFVYPHYGSANTVFQLIGENYAANAASDRVFVDGYEATIVSAGSGSLTIHPAFLPVATPRSMAVVVEASNATSNAVEITAWPSGSVVPFFDRPSAWVQSSRVAANATQVWIADAASGLFVVDRATRVATCVLANGEHGFGVVTGVWFDASGALWITDRLILGSSQRQGRLFRRTPTGGWQPRYVANGDITGVAFDGNGLPWVLITPLATTTTAARIDATGAIDGGSATPLGVVANAITFLSGNAYVLSGGSILKIAANGGSFAQITTLAGPASDITSDGALLYTNGPTGMTSWDTMGNATAYGGPQLANLHGTTFAGAGTFVAALGSDLLLVSNAGGTLGFLAGGISQGAAVTRAAGSFVFAGNADFCLDGLPSGVEVLLVDGTVQSVSTGTCARAVAGANGTLYQLAASGTVSRVDLANGGLTPVATSADGITGSTLASDGANLYASATLSASGDSIAKIPLGGGAPNRDFLAIGAPATNAAVSGGRLWVRMGFTGLGFAALSGPPFTSVTFAHLDSGALGLEADGHGGVFFAEFATVYDVDTAGNVAVATTGAPLPIANMATEPSTGNVLAIGLGLEAFLP